MLHDWHQGMFTWHVDWALVVGLGLGSWHVDCAWAMSHNGHDYLVHMLGKGLCHLIGIG